MTLDLLLYRHADGSVRRYTDVGGYPVFYITEDNGVLCPACVQTERPDVPDDEQAADWKVVAADVNWEDASLYCAHCGDRITAAYGED